MSSIEIAQIANLAGQPAQILAIEFSVGVADHHAAAWRQQRDHAARQHVPARRSSGRLRTRIRESSRRPASGIGAGSARYRRRANGAASRSRAGPTSQSSDGGSRSKIERPWQVTILPANTKRPAYKFLRRGWRRRVRKVHAARMISRSARPGHSRDNRPPLAPVAPRNHGPARAAQ